MRLAAGARVGPYEVVATLGVGGMGEVYRARDTRLGREVALKVISDGAPLDPERLQRFEQEARLAGSLNHPNLVVVYDVGSEGSGPFLVTELLEGESLRHRLSRGRLPLRTALDLSAQVAEGLAAAHARGIVHRDIKPENVFVTSGGRAKLLDFGIAKLTAPKAIEGSRNLLDTTLTPEGIGTRPGAVLGTPGYMSPEQVRGDPVDARTDIFSLGVVLYEMLAGAPAFPAKNLIESGHAILEAEPPPLPDSVPPSIELLVRRCLEKEPARRFQSAADLAFDLGAAAAPTSGKGPPIALRTSPLSVARLGQLGAVLALVAALTVGYLAIRLRREAKTAAVIPSIQRLTGRPGAAFGGRFGPGGRTVFFTGTWDNEKPQVYSLTIGASGTESDYHPVPLGASAALNAVSPSGELAVVVSPGWTGMTGGAGTLARVPGVGGIPRELADGINGADWASDGTSLAVLRQGQENRVEFPIGRILYRSPHPLWHIAVSKGSLQRVAFTESTSFFNEGSSNLIVLEPTGEKQVVLKDWLIAGVRWSEDERTLWFAGTKPADSDDYEGLWTLVPGSAPHQVFRGPGNLTLDDIGAGQRALVRSYQFYADVGLATTNGQTIRERLGYFDSGQLGDLSPDGKLVLFSEGEWTGTMWSYLRRLGESGPVRLGQGKPLSLSADGKWALVVDKKGSGLSLLPTASGTSRSVELPELEILSARLRNGTKSAFVVARRATDIRGYLVDLDSGASKAVTGPLSLAPPAISPDETRVLVLPSEGPLTIYDLRPDWPSTPLTTLGREHFPVGWCERGIVLRPAGDRAGSSLTLRLYDPAKGVMRDLGVVSPRAGPGVTRIYNARVSRDGNTVAYTYGHYSSSLFLLDFGGTSP